MILLAGLASASDLPLPEWSPRRARYGFDFGFVQGGRVRFPRYGTVVSELDLRLALTYGFPYGGPMLLTGAEVGLGSGTRFVASLNLGYGANTALFTAVGAGLHADPRGPFELHVGVIGGFSVYGSLFAVPDLTATWMW